MFFSLNKFFTILGLLTLFTSASAQSQQSAIQFELLSTVQDCAHEGHKSTWCMVDDLKGSTERSGIVERLNSQFERTLANPEKAKILIAEFSFSNKIVQAKLCEVAKAGVKVVVYLDLGSNPNIDLDACQKDVKKPNYTINYLGGFTSFPDWRLHHNKTILVDAGDGSFFNIDFASGNLSSYGTSLHLENWVMMDAPQTANISKATLCLFEGLVAADKKSQEVKIYDDMDFSKDPIIMDTYTSTIERCYQASNVIPMYQVEKALQAEGIAPIFTPNDENLGSKTLINEIKKVAAIGKGAYIYIAIEHFTKRPVATALKQAVANGVDVRVIFNSGTITGATEVEAGITFYNEQLKGTGIKVRFIETNPDAGGNGQQMHNKFAILNGKRVFSGAGHFTSSGLETNYETLYLTENDVLNRQYAEYFKKLWDLSVDENSLRNGDIFSSSQPEPFIKNFLDFIGQ